MNQCLSGAAQACLAAAAMPMLGQTMNRDDFRPFQMRRFQPCLSYTLNELDPALNERGNDGEPRLRRVRALVRCATKTPGLERFLEHSHRSSMAALLAPRTSSAQDKWSESILQGLQESLLSPAATDKPAAVLLTQSVRTLTIDEVDAQDETATMACVPIKRSDMVAMPGSPPVRTPAPKVLLTWPLRAFDFFKGAKQQAKFLIEHLGTGRVRFTITSADGSVYENMYACDIPTPIIEGVFAHVAGASGPSAPPPGSLRVPAVAGELPEMLQLQIAGFAQIRMRAHVLTAASGPEHTTRPLWFENMKIYRKGIGTDNRAKQPSVCVKAYLHPASATCFCGAHLLAPAQKRWPRSVFTGKHTAVMTLEMCGEALPPQSDRGCPWHGIKCVRNRAFAPGICCSNLKVSFACNHEVQQEVAPSYRGMKPALKKKTGVELPAPIDNAFEREELSMLLGLGAEYLDRSESLFGPSAPPDAKDRLLSLVNEVTLELNHRVERFDMHNLKDNASTSDADLARLDVLAVACLREGGMAQAKLTKQQRVPKLCRPEGPEPTAEEKKLAKHHHWMFPRPGEPFGRRVLVPVARSPDPPDLAQSPAKRPRPNNPAYEYQGMTEYLDPDGLANVREQLRLLMEKPDLPARQRERGLHFSQFLQVCDAEYGPEVDGPLGLPARPLYCKYRSRNDGGRLYPTGMPKAPGWNKGEARSVCIQGAPRELRPFMCCRWARDFDMANAQPEMLRQMPRRLQWADGRAAPTLPELERWCVDRPEYIEHVATFHSLPTDAERYYEYRKDTVKELMIRLMFGGKYESWIKDICAEFRRSEAREPRSERVEALQTELAQLRKDVFESRNWVAFVEQDRARLRREGKKKDDDAIDRAVFARIAQKTEDEVLTVMRCFLKDHGWTVLTLCFDGLITQHRPGRILDLAAMNARILQDTGYIIKIVEKPLFSPTFPVLSLNRA